MVAGHKRDEFYILHTTILYFFKHIEHFSDLADIDRTDDDESVGGVLERSRIPRVRALLINFMVTNASAFFHYLSTIITVNCAAVAVDMIED